MRICRFGENRLGLVEGNEVRDVTAALEELPSCRYPLPPGDMLMANLDHVPARARAVAGSGPAMPLDGPTLLRPGPNPNKITGAPVNCRPGQDEAAIASAM